MDSQAVKYEIYIKYLLWLFVLHTTGVALSLMLIPPEYLSHFGFENYHGRFFQVQAGIFHLVMGVAYLLTLFQHKRAPVLIYFCVITKSIALVFLVVYYFFMESNWIIIISGLGDGAMGLILLILYNQLRQSPNHSLRI